MNLCISIQQLQSIIKLNNENETNTITDKKWTIHNKNCTIGKWGFLSSCFWFSNVTNQWKRFLLKRFPLTFPTLFLFLLTPPDAPKSVISSPNVPKVVSCFLRCLSALFTGKRVRYVSSYSCLSCSFFDTICWALLLCETSMGVSKYSSLKSCMIEDDKASFLLRSWFFFARSSIVSPRQ